MKKLVLIYGLIAGIINAALMMILMPLWSESKDFSMGEVFGYLSMVLALSMIFVGIYKYRQHYGGGSITFLKAFKIGILITLIASAIYVAGWMIYSHFINPGVMDEYFNYALEQVRNSDASAAEIERKVEEMKKFKEMYQNTWIQIGITFTEILPVGIIMTIIASLVLKRKQ